MTCGKNALLHTILDTSFLIDLERENVRDCLGLASKALTGYIADHPLNITFTIAGELGAGKSLAERHRWEAFIRPYQILPFSLDVA